MRLLVVDDEDFELHGLISMMKSLSLPIEVLATARNGREGLLKAQALRPDAVLTDLRMPQMSGIEMLRELHRDMPELSSVLISGFEDFRAAREGFELGMIAYLLKPVSRDELFRALSKLCRPLPQSAPLEDPPPAEAISEDERLLRRLLFAPTERVDALLKESLNGARFLSRMVYMLATLKIQPTGARDMFDYAPLLLRFAAAQGLSAPVVLDGARAALLISAPALLDDSVFIDDTARKAELLLGAMSENGSDCCIGISDIGRRPSQLPALYQQSLATAEQPRGAVSRITFYDTREALSNERQVVSQIQAILEAEYASALSLDSIAERLFLSPSHMRRLFKNKTGSTVMDYLENLRLERSLQLLARPQLKIHEIGCMVGYENPSYFNVVFKRRYGLTPGDYRKVGILPCEK